MSTHPEIELLWGLTRGDPAVCLAVVDGLVDQKHPCFKGANLRRLVTMVEGEARPDGEMSTHGTHIASVIFGQHGSEVKGIAPQCQGLLVPVFTDDDRTLTQMDLARAINAARDAGAQVINFSGGQLSATGDADVLLQDAVRACYTDDVLIVAAAGNDGCACLHIPAALPAVLSVGAMGADGQPLGFSNWGESYARNGILARGENILGAVPGGGVTRLTGTSFAAPIVSGVAALLLSLLRQQNKPASPRMVRQAILDAATPCDSPSDQDCRRFLVGRLNIHGTLDALGFLRASQSPPRRTFSMSEEREPTTAQQQQSENLAASCACSPPEPIEANGREPEDRPAAVEVAPARPAPMQPSAPRLLSSSTFAGEGGLVNASSPRTAEGVKAAGNGTGGGLVYALGTLGYDFGTEARRDSFKQLMPNVRIDNTLVPPNPYDARQMVDYLKSYPSESLELIWTLNLELMPVYAIKPTGSYGRDVYDTLVKLLDGEVKAETDPAYVERVSIPGRLTGETVRLFSGQFVPVIEPRNNRGLYGWEVNSLIKDSLAALKVREPGATEGDDDVKDTLRAFLNKIYYDLRNLGATSRDRALNFAATNAFQASETFHSALGRGLELDTISVEKSPFCRLDSDCWDVKLRFFDPENNRRARRVYRYTIDVSDVLPVSVGTIRQWNESY